eukprot:2170427-Pleurochrysis_carterae.AAC.1
MEKPSGVMRKASKELQDDGGDYLALAQIVVVLCLRRIGQSAQDGVEQLWLSVCKGKGSTSTSRQRRMPRGSGARYLQLEKLIYGAD